MDATERLVLNENKYLAYWSIDGVRSTYDLSILIFIENVQGRTKGTAEDGRVLCDSISAPHYLDIAGDRRTGNNSQLAPQIRQPNVRNVKVVDENSSLRSLNETEERQRKRALARPSPAENADLLSRLDLEVKVVEDVGQLRLAKWSARPR